MGDKLIKIFISHPPVGYPQRLHYVLDFLWNRFRVSWEAREDDCLISEIVISTSDDSPSITLPCQLDWLNVSDVEKMSWSPLDFNWNQPNVFRSVFCVLSEIERLHTGQGDVHHRWLAPAGGTDPDRRQAFLDDAANELAAMIFDPSPDAFTSSRYEPVLSVDIDQWYAYKNKGIWRSITGSIRDLYRWRWDRLSERFAVLFLGATDPYDSFSFLEKTARKSGARLQYFILPTLQTQFDKQVKIPSSVMLQKTEGASDVGLHPSYYVHERGNLLEGQIREWEQTFLRRPRDFRFHYLRSKWGTSRQLMLKNGFTSDYTEALVGDIGFSKGTCHPHRWYDLASDSMTDLIIYPQIAMDVTLKDYLGYEPQEIIDQMQSIILQCKKHSGWCSLIWHNSSFDKTEDWEGFDDVLTEILQLMSE